MSSKKRSKEEQTETEIEEEAEEAEDGTVALLKKRSRRVSFAEITTLHVFDPDDDNDAPSDPPLKNNNNNDNNNNNNYEEEELELEKFERDLGLGREEEEEEEEDDDEFEDRPPFLRPDRSPSTVGSNDEDNYFGPVLTGFIRPGRLSDSGTSDVHEMTMDSTVFSQHFRSLAKSDSGVDLETPTTAHLSFEENTPNQNTFPSSEVGSSMLMNSAKKAITAYSTSVEKFSGGSHSNDMSLVENNPNKHDYGSLSFGWEEALLAHGVKELHTTDYIASPISDPTSKSTDELNDCFSDMLNKISSPIRDPTSKSTDALNHSSDMLNEGIFSSREPDASEISRKAESHVNSSIVANQESEVHHLDGILSTKKFHASEMSPKAELHVNSGTAENQQSGIPRLDGMLSNKKPDCSMSPKVDPHVNSGSTVNQASEIPPLDVSSQHLKESPMARSLPPLSKQSQSVFRGARASNTLPTGTITPQNHVLSVTDKTKRRSETVPSVQKSISKLKILNASPFASDLNLKLKSVLIPSESLYRTPPHNTSLHRIIEDAEIKHVDVSAARESRYTETMSNMKLNSVTISENLLDGSAKFGNSSAPRSREVLVREQSSALTGVRSLVSQLNWSGNLLTTECSAGNKVVTPGKDSVFTKIALDHANIMKVAGTPGKTPVHSIEESVLRKSASKRIRDDAVEEIHRLEKDSKVQKGIGREIEVLPGHHSKSNIEKSISGDESRLRNWKDVLSEFLAKQMLPPSIDKLNSQAMGVLEDRMVQLQRSQTYDMHHDIIQSQRSVEDLANLQSKRTAEAKLLLHRLMHERAKLQLMQVKEEKLQRNVQLLRNGIQEAQLLKLNSLPQLSAGSTKDDKSINIRGRDKEEAVPCDKVTELRQLRDTLESKLMYLTKSVLSSCKLKEILSHTDTVSTVNGYLKKKECCKYLRSYLEMYKVNKISTTNRNRNLVLDYLDLIIQRITFKAGSASSLTISNELNDDIISKSFPNMDASTALSFVINAIDTQKYVGSPTLAQVTQKTSSVLGNLVDVAEEVQQAHFELQNLTYTRFFSPSVGQLDLNLHFIGIKSGRKLELTLDMSCLKWGLYPSDIMAYKLEGSSVISRESLSEHLSAEIRAAIQCLDVGFTRILRLCRTVSHVVQTWNR